METRSTKRTEGKVLRPHRPQEPQRIVEAALRKTAITIRNRKQKEELKKKKEARKVKKHSKKKKNW